MLWGSVHTSNHPIHNDREHHHSYKIHKEGNFNGQVKSTKSSLKKLTMSKTYKRNTKIQKVKINGHFSSLLVEYTLSPKSNFEYIYLNLYHIKNNGIHYFTNF